MPPTFARPYRTYLLLLAGIAIAAVAIERGRVAKDDAPGSAPQWIWADGEPRAIAPIAILFARDIELGVRPAVAAIEVHGDPEYVLYFNGTRVGSGVALAPFAVDRFEVGDLVVAGSNRIVVESRSATGIGGVWLKLVDGGGAVLAASDRSWTVYRGFWHGVLGARPLFPSERPRSWGRTPVGRWRIEAPVRPLPTFEASVAGAEVRLASRWRAAGAGRFRPLSTAPKSRRALGPHVEFDFGGEVCGYAQIETRGATGGTALVGYGPRIERGSRIRADAAAVLLAGRDWWQAATPRCFRYLNVAGLETLSAASVIGVKATSIGALAAPTTTEVGLLGLDPPRSRTPMEDVIRRQLEGGAGLAGGQ